MEIAEAAEAAWTELRDQMSDLRLPWTGSMTPRARERAVSQHLGTDTEALAALHRLALSVERARYANSHFEGAAPAADVRVVASSLSRRAGRAGRIRAALMPVSLLPDLQAGLDRAMGRLRRPGALNN
jgi:hypothetical protein